MKLILSRKGFDSTPNAKCGGVPSPVFKKDGKIISLPIPVYDNELIKGSNFSICYDDLEMYGHNYGDLVEDLTKNNIMRSRKVHLDPDIERTVLKNRDESWKPLFGQNKAAEGHLRNQKIEKGDVFLFFGLFNWAEKSNGTYVYCKKSDPFHMIWGWMQIGDIIKLDERTDQVEDWMRYHVHFHLHEPKKNTIYIASNKLVINDKIIVKDKGAGVFNKYDQGMHLTKAGSKIVSLWELPLWFLDVDMTYHYKKKDWAKDGLKASIKTAYPGQEFVVESDHYPELVKWLTDLIEK